MRVISLISYCKTPESKIAPLSETPLQYERLMDLNCFLTKDPIVNQCAEFSFCKTEKKSKRLT